MADFGRGIKAGLVIGLVYMAIAAILGAIYQNNPLSVPHFLHFLYGAGLTPLFSLAALTAPSFCRSPALAALKALKKDWCSRRSFGYSVQLDLFT